MKRIFILLMLLSLGAILIMCSGEQKQEATTEETAPEVTTTVVADTSMVTCDGGCTMQMDKAKMVSHTIEGKKHYFCSEMCKENYLTKMSEIKKEK